MPTTPPASSAFRANAESGGFMKQESADLLRKLTADSEAVLKLLGKGGATDSADTDDLPPGATIRRMSSESRRLGAPSDQPKLSVNLAKADTAEVKHARRTSASPMIRSIAATRASPSSTDIDDADRPESGSSNASRGNGATNAASASASSSASSPPNHYSPAAMSSPRRQARAATVKLTAPEPAGAGGGGGGGGRDSPPSTTSAGRKAADAAQARADAPSPKRSTQTAANGGAAVKQLTASQFVSQSLYNAATEPKKMSRERVREKFVRKYVVVVFLVLFLFLFLFLFLMLILILILILFLFFVFFVFVFVFVFVCSALWLGLVVEVVDARRLCAVTPAWVRAPLRAVVIRCHRPPPPPPLLPLLPLLPRHRQKPNNQVRAPSAAQAAHHADDASRGRHREQRGKAAEGVPAVCGERHRNHARRQGQVGRAAGLAFAAVAHAARAHAQGEGGRGAGDAAAVRDHHRRGVRRRRRRRRWWWWWWRWWRCYCCCSRR
jgi:hypothetical protein